MADAELYVSACGGQREYSGQVLEELGPSLCWREAILPVLDVGCGAGDTTVLELLPRLPPSVEVVAADASDAMLEKARARFPKTRVHFCHLDIGTRALVDSDVWRHGPYSKVFSFFCLHWVQDQRTALRNMNELLATNGEVVLIIVARCPVFNLYEEFSKLPEWSPYMQDYENFVSPYHRENDPEQHLRSMLEETGFTVKTCREEKDFAFSSNEQQKIVDSLTAINPFAVRMLPAQRESFLKKLVRASYQNGTLSKGAVVADSTENRFHFSVLVAHAVKNRGRITKEQSGYERI